MLTVTADTNDVLWAVRIKKDSDVARFPALFLRLVVSGTDTSALIWLNTSTGATVESSAVNGGATSFGSIDEGNWWVLWAVAPNTSNTSAVIRLYPAAGAVIGTLAVSTTGSAIFDGATIIENQSYPTSPILKTGVVTRKTDAPLLFDVNNFPDAEGSMEFELTPDFVTSGQANEGIISPSTLNQNFVYFRTTTGNLTSFDGANALHLGLVWAVAGQTSKIKLRWSASAGKKNLSSNGTKASEGTYDGSFSPSGNIYLFRNGTYGASVKNLKIYNEDKGDTWLQE